MISPADVIVRKSHRAIKPWLLEQLKQSMTDHGYNDAYPIVIEQNNTLVEGRHRIEAAKAIGLETVPCIYKPADVSPIRFGLQCNADGQLTAADDVFDLAELCWTLANDGWKGQQIADELSKHRTAVEQLKAIKENLHTKAWNTARSVTSNQGVVTNDGDGIVTPIVTNVTWQESHFRAFLSHLPCPNGDRAAMRAQVQAITELMRKPDKLTAKTAGETAEHHAWYTFLAKYMTTNLVADVGVGSRKTLLHDIRSNVYGKAESKRDLERFGETIQALNERALGIKLYQADALQFLPTLPDKTISLVVTDPPYNTTEHAWDQMGTDGEFMAWMQEWTQALLPKLKDEYHVFVFCDPDYFAPLEMMLRADGWPIKSRIIWEYRNLVKGRDVTDKFIENYQVCLHLGTHALNWPPEWDDSRFMVQEFATPQSNFKEGKHHPTAKPVALVEHLVKIGSKAGDTVLDMFAGGGTMGEACRLVKERRCVLVEIDDEYCAVIEQRLGIGRVR